jgi:hypothetical protein
MMTDLKFKFRVKQVECHDDPGLQVTSTVTALVTEQHRAEPEPAGLSCGRGRGRGPGPAAAMVRHLDSW